MEIFESINSLLLFILFFIPGFISMQVYSMFIAKKKLDFSKAIYEAIGFSSINFAALFWLIILIHKNKFYENHLGWYLFFIAVILFIAPVIWSILLVLLRKSRFLCKFVLNPVQTPWDFFFDKRESCWVIVNLNNNEKIGGVYSKNSFASSFPSTEQIYLEELWKIDSQGNFLNRINRTKGVIILAKDVKSIEFYK